MASNTSLLLELNSDLSHQEAVQQFLKNASIPAGPDVHEVNQADTVLQIDDVRKLIQEMAFRPYQSDRSVFIIYAIEHASVPAQNALLKSLEEPPPYVQIVLTTQRLDQVLPTIQSRCLIQRITSPNSVVTPQLSAADIQQLLQNLASSYSVAFAISETYSERPQALEFLQQLLVFFHQKNQQDPQLGTIQAVRAIVATQQLLEKNVNVRLALEDLLFTLKTAVFKAD